MRRLNGRRVLITGGARGIGRELAARFAAQGAQVVLTDVDEAALAETASSLGAAVSGHVVDVTDAAAIDELRARLHADGGPVEVLVNNAGVVFGGSLLDVPLERHLLTYRVNLLGLVMMTRAFLPDLIGSDEGHLVNVASAAGLVGLPYGSTYASSKWGVIGFSESVRLELVQLGHRHVRVTAVCPSYVGTGLFDGATPPRATRVLTTERLADRVVHAVRRNRRYVLVPWLVRVTPLLKGVLPGPVFDRVADLFGATTGMLHWRGRS
jgi:short-subunit dehydrogenase